MRPVPFERGTVDVTSGPDAPLRLESRFAAGTSGAAVIAPPHPLYGGTLDNPVVQSIARGIHAAGASVLVFNYRGIGASQGRATDSLEAAVADYGASLAALSARARGPVLAAGYSFGAGTAVLCAKDDARIAGLILVAPPVRMLRSEDLRGHGGKIFVLAGEHDELSPEAELRAVLAARPDAGLELITGADHFFHFGGLAEIEKSVAAAARRMLAPS